jgi:predicted phosphodiesterase
MRIALVSDVHGNLPALRVALAALRREGYDRLLCPGDLVGYGPFPNECVALLAESDALCVAGNHDLMAIERLDLPRNQLVRVTNEWTRGALDADARSYLEALPPTVELESLVMAHGSLGDPTVYVTRDRAGAEMTRFAAAHPGAAQLVLGHTHTPLAYAERRGAVLEARAGRVAIDPDERLLVNPGSVGQPRERRPLVRWALIDLEACEASYGAASYEHELVRTALAERGLPPDACHRRPSLPELARRRWSRLRYRLTR